MNTEADDYSYLFSKFEKDIICNRYKLWYEQMLGFIENSGMKNFVRIDRRKLGYAILSYFADVYRIKDFHKIEKINNAKIYAYSSYWIARMSPLQLIDNVDDKWLHINEKFITSVIVSNVLRRLGEKEVRSYEDCYSVEQFSKLLYYNLIYRTYNAQTLELAITGVFTGATIRSFNNDF